MSRRLTLLGLSALITLATSCADSPGEADSVEERGAEVMPFDLKLTTHTFTKTSEGGAQNVVANDPNDGEQVTLIQRHLVEEAERFRNGDFADPARIHGMDMPGLKELEAGAGRFRVEYTDEVDGATITYSADDPVLVAALHSWFDRQTADHG